MKNRTTLLLPVCFLLGCSTTSGEAQFGDESTDAAENDDASGGTTSGGTTSGGTTSGGTTSGGTTSGGTTSGGSGDALVWDVANLTWYTSYPDPGSEECIVYNGCMWAGYFAGLNGQQSKEWVAENNIAAVHEDDFPGLNGKTLRLRQDGREIDVVVYDKCADSDCSGCCTNNAHPDSGALIDLESHTKERFGSGYGVVEWACIDC